MISPKTHTHTQEFPTKKEKKISIYNPNTAGVPQSGLRRNPKPQRGFNNLFCWFRPLFHLSIVEITATPSSISHSCIWSRCSRTGRRKAAWERALTQRWLMEYWSRNREAVSTHSIRSPFAGPLLPFGANWPSQMLDKDEIMTSGHLLLLHPQPRGHRQQFERTRGLYNSVSSSVWGS